MSESGRQESLLLCNARSLYEANVYSSAIFLKRKRFTHWKDSRLSVYMLNLACTCGNSEELWYIDGKTILWDLAYKSVYLNKDLCASNIRHEILHDYGECAFVSGNPDEAIRILIEIPESSRTLKVWILLGNIYENSFSMGHARKCYLSALKMNNFAVEAIDGALRTGAELEAIFGVISDTSEDMKQIAKYCKAEQALMKSDYNASYQIFNRLSEKFASSTELAQSLYTCNYLSGNRAEAYNNFGRILARDLDFIACVPMQAVILRERGMIEELDSLRKTIYSTEKGTPECYILSAYLADATGDTQKALKYAEKALKMRNRFVEGWIVKGKILAKLGKHSEALQSYWIAASIRNCVEPYEGIIKCLIKLRRFNEATAVSTMIAKKHTKNSRVIAMCVDVVLARKCLDYLNDAKFLLQKALNINPHCLASVMKYSQVLILDKNYDHALEFIDSHLKQMDYPILHSLKGDVYVCKYAFHQAEVEYSIALHLDSMCSQAKKGLNHMQTLFKSDNTKVRFGALVYPQYSYAKHELGWASCTQSVMEPCRILLYCKPVK